MDPGNFLGPASPSLPSYTPVEQLCVAGNGIDIQGFYSVRTGDGAEQLFYYDEIRFNDDLTRGLMPNEITLPRTQLRAIGVVGDRYGLPTGPGQVTDYVIVGIKAGVLGEQALRFSDVPRCSVSKVFSSIAATRRSQCLDFPSMQPSRRCERAPPSSLSSP